MSRNPFDLLICDTDALIQIFCTKQDGILKKLRSQYGIQASVTEAVEGEMLRPNRKHGHCCQDGFRKALESELIVVIDKTTISRFTSTSPQSVYDSIQLLGQKYGKVIGRGEAFTHAAAHILKAAVLSNDWKAVRAADRNNFDIGKPTLRYYDLIVLLHQTGDFLEKDCDAIRKALVDIGDQPHSAFANKKFVEGLPSFYPRLVLGGVDPVGSKEMTELGDQDRCEITSTSE